jgi:YggT family protein
VPDTIHNALLFLTTTVFDIYLFVLAIRVLLAKANANYFDPLTQFVIKLSDVFVKPIRRYIPNLKGFESATILLIFAFEFIKFFIISVLGYGLPNIVGLVIMSAADFVKLFINTFFYAIFLQAILSWIQPYSPMNRILYQVTEPLMQPIRRVIPPISGFDISPIPALIGLQFLIIILVNPLMTFGLSVAFG